MTVSTTAHPTVDRPSSPALASLRGNNNKGGATRTQDLNCGPGQTRPPGHHFYCTSSFKACRAINPPSLTFLFSQVITSFYIFVQADDHRGGFPNEDQEKGNLIFAGSRSTCSCDHFEMRLQVYPPYPVEVRKKNGRRKRSAL
jgi:hypothetical protein